MGISDAESASEGVNSGDEEEINNNYHDLNNTFGDDEGEKKDSNRRISLDQI